MTLVSYFECKQKLSANQIINPNQYIIIMFRQQVTQITNCTCRIIPDKNQYMVFRSPDTTSNKKTQFKEKVSLKNHSTSAHKKYVGALSSQKKSLKYKKINQMNRTSQNQTICNNFDAQKDVYYSPQQLAKRNLTNNSNKYSFKMANQQNLKTNAVSEDLNLQVNCSKVSKYVEKPCKKIKQIEQYCNNPIDFIQTDQNLKQNYKNRPATQYQMQSHLNNKNNKYQWHQNQIFSQVADDHIKKNQPQKSNKFNKNKQNHSGNFNTNLYNFNFDKIKDYRKETIIQRQNPVKRPLNNAYSNTAKLLTQTFHSSLQKYYTKHSSTNQIFIKMQTKPLINQDLNYVQPNQHINLKVKKQKSNEKHFKMSQSKFIRNSNNSQNPSIINESIVKESKSFATTVTGSLLPSGIHNFNQQAKSHDYDPTIRNISQHSIIKKNEKNWNYSSAFNSNLNIVNQRQKILEKTQINDRLKTFNDLISDQNQTQSVYEDEDQNQNEFSQVLMSYRNIFQKSGIIQPMSYKLLSQDEYLNKYETDMKQKQRGKQNTNFIQKQRQYLTNNFNPNE